MIRIGLTGSIAMGKSAVASILVQRGVRLFDSDQEVHKLYESAEGVELLRPLVPEAIEDGKVDRSTLSKIVTAAPHRLDQLEHVIHAEIAKRREAFFAMAAADGHRCAVADVPLLFEKGGDRDVDVTIVVSTPQALQEERAMARPGMTRAKFDMITKRQMPDAEKRKRATHVIANTGTLADLEAQTIAVLNTICKDT